MKATECLKDNVQELLFMEEVIVEVLYWCEADVASSLNSVNLTN